MPGCTKYPPHTMSGSLPSDEVGKSYTHPVGIQGLILGPLTFQWEDGILTVKTPTERHFLNRLQTAELPGYLYDQRATLLNKVK